MVKELKVINFRNFIEKNLIFDKNITIIIGKNGTGKTSILEAIYYMSISKSFRTQDYINLINFNKEYFKIELKTEKYNLKNLTTKKTRYFETNEKKDLKVSDYIFKFKAFIFSKYDIQNLLNLPQGRRNFIDLELSLENKEYLNILKEYKNVLQDRNKYLKNLNIETSDFTLLDILSEKLLFLTQKIINYRKQYISDLNQILFKNRLNKQNYFLKIIYKQNVSIEKFKKHLFENQKSDIILKNTQYGIHKDDFEFYYNDNLDIKNNISEGQKKVACLEIKYASLIYSLNINDDKEIILLLDDIFSELDFENQKSIFEKISLKNIQIITNSVNYLKFLDKYNPKVINLE